MSFLNSILNDLREKRLWPVALALVVALIAVPVLLSKSSTAQPLAQLPQTSPASPAATGVPVVSVSSTPGHSRLRGHARDPFKQQKLPTPKSTTTTGTSTTPTGTATTPTGTTATGTGTTTPVTGTTTTTTPTVTRPPTPTELTARQSYRVTLSITNATGGVDRIDPLERLSVLPSFEQAQLIDLGVLDGGRRVLFVVEPGTTVAGPGTCTPGPIDCEILSLAPNQIEDLTAQTPSGAVSTGQFAVTAITRDEHSSVTEANAARRRESAAGRRLLRQSTLSALSVFVYKASLGAVADLRNLTVGGR